MLPKVSRTFALCIRLLPERLEYPVLLAYLLCRIADTIEDTADIEPAEKASLLREFGERVGDHDARADSIRQRFSEPRTDEETLAGKADTVLAEFRLLPTDQQDAIRPWVREMCNGMADFASGQANGGGGLHTLRSLSDLEQYCYYVAGTVGHLLTELFATQPGIDDERRGRLSAVATSFGLGLQLTNIIKDVADDRDRGWSFVPHELCAEAGIVPQDLHDPAHRPAAARVMDRLIEQARSHLRDALEYCTTLPRSEYRIRMFCLTSMYFAVRTLRLAANDPRLLDPDHKVKISRQDVYWTVGSSGCVAPSNTLIRLYYDHLADGGTT